jgi:hypothetical protein
MVLPSHCLGSSGPQMYGLQVYMGAAYVLRSVCYWIVFWEQHAHNVHTGLNIASVKATQQSRLGCGHESIFRR